MTCMDSTTRVRTAIAFHKPDRVPYWDNPWGNFLTHWQKWAGVGPAVTTADYYGSDIYGEICPAENFFYRDKRIMSEDQEFIYLRDGWGWEVRRHKKEENFSEHLRLSLPNGMTLDNVQFDSPLLEDRFRRLPELVAREDAAGRCRFSKSGGIYCRTQFMYGEADLLMDMLAAPGRVHEVMGKVAEFLTALALENLRRTDAWENGLWICDDCAGSHGPMFGPAQFTEFLLPLYKTMLARLRAAGCRHVFFHSDGNIRPLLEMLLDAGFEGFNPLEPRCGMDLVSLKKSYGNRFVCFGGVCNTRILPGGDKKAIESHVRPLLEMASDGGIILGCASIGEDVQPEIYHYYRKLIQKYGNYAN